MLGVSRVAHTNVRRQLENVICHGDLAPGICAPLFVCLHQILGNVTPTRTSVTLIWYWQCIRLTYNFMLVVGYLNYRISCFRSTSTLASCNPAIQLQFDHSWSDVLISLLSKNKELHS